MSRPVGSARMVEQLRAYVEPSIRERLEEIARLNDRSLSNEIRQALKAHIARHEEKR